MYYSLIYFICNKNKKKTNKSIWWRLLLVSALLLTGGLGCSSTRRIKSSLRFQEDNLFSAAEKLYKSGEFEEAETLYKGYLRFEPNSSLADNALFRLGEIAMKRKDYDMSVRFFETLINNYTESELLPSARFNAAHSLFLNSYWDNALLELKKFQKDFPLSQYEPEVQSMLADIYLKNKKYQQAKEAASKIIKQFPDSKLQNKAIYQLGLSEMYLNEEEMAAYHLEQALSMELSEDYKQNILYSLGTIYLIKGDLYLAVKYFSDLVKQRQTEEGTQRIVQKIEGLMKGQFNEELLIRIIEENPQEFPADIAMLEIVDRKLKEYQFSDAIYYCELFLANFPYHQKSLEIENKLSLFKEKSSNSYSGKFGCIAPLTGPLSEYGEKMIKGIKMAIEEYNQAYGVSVKLVLFDSQAKPDMAQKGVELLAYQEKVAAIIGPLLTSTAIAAAEVAEQIGIPLFTPTATGEGLPETGKYIFRNCLTNRHQAEALANFAVNEMGITRFGIVFPFNAYGQEMMALFADQVDKLGANIEIIEFYEPHDTDFKDQLIRTHQIRPEAVFLPDSYEKIVLIAPQIPFYEPEEADPNDPNQIDHYGSLNQDLDANDPNRIEFPPPEELDYFFLENTLMGMESRIEEEEKKEEKKPIQLFGADGWYDKRIIKEGGSYINRSIISVGFYPESNDHKIRRFLNNFQSRYGKEPDLVSAQSYDATNMLLEASDAGAASWDTTRDRLSKIQDYPGVSGRTSILPSGDSDKEVTLLQIMDRKFNPIERSDFNLKYESY